MTKLTPLMIIFCLCVYSGKGISQDTIRVMAYNLLNFPSQDQQRADTLKKIVQYAQPDALLVNELTAQYGANLILNNALNQDGVTHYQQATFMNGPDTDNLLFYNSDKLELVEQNAIPTTLRDINEYVLYYKAPDLATTHDTVFFYMYSLHLKASSGSSNEQQRLQEAQYLKNYLNNRQGLMNVCVGGDFNFYSNTEPGLTEILTGGNVDLFDPIDMIGDWHNNSAYAGIHTQSTRSSGGGLGTGATGGMDDRFDFIFINDDLKNASKGARYITGSYEAMGQDGNHFNNSINTGSNGVVPMDVANALFQMSDHLPVCMEIEVGGDVGVVDYPNEIVWGNYDPMTGLITLKLNEFEKELKLNLYDLSGKIVQTKTFDHCKEVNEYLAPITGGMYILSVEGEEFRSSFKFVVE